MEPHEVALSDVHVYGSSLTSSGSAYKDYQVAKTRFLYTLDPEALQQSCDSGTSSSASLAVDPETNISGRIELDEDGDLKVERKPRANIEVLTIEHTMATRLPDVGLQVWQGCLLLCDYILDQSTSFRDAVVLELGGGTGLASVVVAMVAKAVICTDIGQEILMLCQKNIDTHRCLYTNKTVIVRELNWTRDELNTSVNSRSGSDRFTWNDVDVDLYNNVDIIIAADVIYDDDLTDSFFKTIYKLMCQKPGRRTIIALEKRLNFTLSDFEVSCPAYNHYRECLNELSSLSHRNDVKFTVSQVTDIQQFFFYNRNKYLELWEISSQHVKNLC